MKEKELHIVNILKEERECPATYHILNGHNELFKTTHIREIVKLKKSKLLQTNTYHYERFYKHI